jgi:hypothetical protein
MRGYRYFHALPALPKRCIPYGNLGSACLFIEAWRAPQLGFNDR